MLIFHPKSAAINVTQRPLPPAHTLLLASFDMAELALNYFEIRGAGVKYRKTGVVFFPFFFDVFVCGGTKRIFLWCQNLDQVGCTPRKASLKKVDK